MLGRLVTVVIVFQAYWNREIRVRIGINRDGEGHRTGIERRNEGPVPGHRECLHRRRDVAVGVQGLEGLRLKPCSQKGQGQAQENMPRVHLSIGLNGEFADKLETSGCGNPQCVETGIPADGEKDRTIRRIETCGIVVSGRGSQ